MQIARIAALLLAVVSAEVFTQTATPAEPRFDVVSVKRNLTHGPSQRWLDRPDGGFTATNMPVSLLISRAYRPVVPAEMIGLPAWVRTESYDVTTTSSLSRATPEDRTAMLRAMLADRFKLVVHFEKRDRDVYDLILARRDGKLGTGIEPASDCGPSGTGRAGTDNGIGGAAPLNTQTPRPDEPPSPCTFRTVAAALRRDGQRQLGDLLEGDGPIDSLAAMLRLSTRRLVINKTNLSGSYRVKMNFDMEAAFRGPESDGAQPNAASPVFTAIQEQLGMKLQPSKALLDTLVIDRLEKPTDN